MKKILSFALCLVIISSVAFQCSIQSSAIAGVDDAVVLGLCMDLLAMGITIHSVSQFCQSDTFAYFCQEVGNSIDHQIEIVKNHGKMFVLTTAVAWSQLTSWIKSKFSGRNETKTIEYDVETETTPSDITLRNGTTVPYAEFMSNPFFIYAIGADIRAVCCTGSDPGMVWGTRLIQIWCTGHGQVKRFDLVNGSWSELWVRDMNYGLNYKGTTGSFYNLEFSSNVHADTEEFYLYRTMQRTNSSGGVLEQQPPNIVPDVEETTTATVTMSSNPIYYPGAADAPAEVIAQGDSIAIEVPQECIINAGTANEILTNDRATIGTTVATLNPSDVKPKVITNTGASAAVGTVDQIIADTPAAEMDGTNAGSAETDIETANKFRLPKSFLEGFPFSIPYSVYVGIQSFVADPQTPSFTIPFSIPRLGISENMEIDLSQWNPIARLCRALLSLVWVAGLAMACSKFIKR